MRAQWKELWRQVAYSSAYSCAVEGGGWVVRQRKRSIRGDAGRIGTTHSKRNSEAESDPELPQPPYSSPAAEHKLGGGESEAGHGCGMPKKCSA